MLLKNFFFVFFICVLSGVSLQAKEKKITPLVKILNATILWIGDFAGAYDFAGPYNKLIKGEASVSELGQKSEKKNPENCDVSAHFSEVVTRFIEKNEPAYKVFFLFECMVDGKKRTTQTPAFFIRIENLLGPTNRIHVSEKMRNFQFFIKEISSLKSTSIR